MKKLYTLLIVALPFMAFTQEAQEEVKAEIEEIKMMSCVFIDEPEYEYFVELKYKNGKISNDPSDLVVYGDTVCAILQIFTELNKTKTLLYTATKVFNYQNMDGTITSWRKWNKAVNEYIKMRDEYNGH